MATYLALLAIQIAGAVFLIWKELPTFGQLVRSPGVQPPSIPYDDLTTIVTLLAMQVAYWYRMKIVPIPFRCSNLIWSHVFLFSGRLSFIFGGALFSVVFFRHLPELGPDADIPLMIVRGILLAASLFALFCLTLELERLGHALEVDYRN